MFGPTDSDRLRKLGAMYAEAYRRSNFNKLEARERLAEWLAADRNFDGLNHERLAKRVEECRSDGSRLNLQEEYLRGGERRQQPLLSGSRPA